MSLGVAEQDPVALASLQEELQGLKQAFLRVQLKKTPPQSSRDAPFPVTAIVGFQAPPVAAAYNVAGFKVKLSISSQTVRPGANLEERASGVGLTVESEELPEQLRSRMAEILREEWLQTIHAGTSLQLARLLLPCARDFVRLITSLPELVEPYESVNDDGATVRCYTIINTDTQVQIDTSGGASQPAPILRPNPTPRPASTPYGQRRPANPPASAYPNAPPTFPPALQGEITYMQRRYGSAFRITHAPAHDPTSGTLVSPKPHDLAGYHQGADPSGSRRHPPAEGDASYVEFALALTPSDPAWARPPLALYGRVAKTYPAPGSLTLALSPLSALPADAVPLPADQRATSAGRGATSAGRGATSADRHATSAGNGATSADQRATSAGRDATSADQHVSSPGRGVTSTDWHAPSAGTFPVSADVAPLSVEVAPRSADVAHPSADVASLPADVAQLVDRAIRGEIAKLGSRGDALRTVMRFIDQRASQLVDAAEDVLLERRGRGGAKLGNHPDDREVGGSTVERRGHGGAKLGAHADDGEVIGSSLGRRGHGGAKLGSHADDGEVAGSIPDGRPRDTWDASAAHMGAKSAKAQAGELADRPEKMSLIEDAMWAAAKQGETHMVAKGAETRPGALADRFKKADFLNDAMWATASGERQGSEESEEESSGGSWEGSSEGEESEESEEDGAEGSGVCQEGRHVGGGEWGGELGLGASAVEMRLEGLQLDGVDAIEPVRLALQVSCGRCSNAETLDFFVDMGARDPRAQASRPCQNCHQQLSLTIEPRLIHERSNLLALLVPIGCRPSDLLPSLLSGQCGVCSATLAFRGVQVGAAAERSCSSCHTQVSLSFQAATFQLRSRGEAAPGSSRKPSRTKNPRTAARPSQQLAPGQPLPDFGACKHYRLSHRWLRFPCCGQRFPCDLCHEEGTDGHTMKWAMRMVCGYCSTEQPLGARCIACNKRVARSAKGPLGAVTRHWEGGEGCRDKRLLDRRDAAKYKDSKHKTKSRKSVRVGPEGARRRKAKEDA